VCSSDLGPCVCCRKNWLCLAGQILRCRPESSEIGFVSPKPSWGAIHHSSFPSSTHRLKRPCANWLCFASLTWVGSGSLRMSAIASPGCLTGHDRPEVIRYSLFNCYLSLIVPCLSYNSWHRPSSVISIQSRLFWIPGTKGQRFEGSDLEVPAECRELNVDPMCRPLTPCAREGLPLTRGTRQGRPVGWRRTAANLAPLF
jgi:hypothetical protein